MLDKGRISSVTPTIKINRVSCWMWGPAEARDSIGKVRRGGNCPGSGTKRAPACDFRTEDSFETTEATLADCRSGVVAIAIFAAFEFKGGDKPQYYVSKVDKGDIRQEVDATGTINAVTTVQVGSQVSGT